MKKDASIVRVVAIRNVNDLPEDLQLSFEVLSDR